MTREWKSPPRASEHPNHVDTHIIRCTRSDDVCFMLISLLPLEEAYKEFDTFLDPRCECVVGKNCEMHGEAWGKGLAQ